METAINNWVDDAKMIFVYSYNAKKQELNSKIQQLDKEFEKEMPNKLQCVEQEILDLLNFLEQNPKSNKVDIKLFINRECPNTPQTVYMDILKEKRPDVYETSISQYEWGGRIK